MILVYCFKSGIFPILKLCSQYRKDFLNPNYDIHVHVITKVSFSLTINILTHNAHPAWECNFTDKWIHLNQEVMPLSGNIYVTV